MRNPTSALLGAVKRRKRSVASVVSVSAIAALALGTLGTGVAVAHGAPPFNSVGAWQLKGPNADGGPAVHSYHVGQGQVKSYQVRDGSVHEKDLSEGVQDQLGKGPKGDKGDPGEDGVSGYEVVGTEDRFSAGTHELTANCPENKVAIGGGYQASADGANGGNTDVHAADLSDVTQTEDGTWQATSYTVAFDNSDATGSGGEGNQGNMRVRVTCASMN